MGQGSWPDHGPPKHRVCPAAWAAGDIAVSCCLPSPVSGSDHAWPALLAPGLWPRLPVAPHPGSSRPSAVSEGPGQAHGWHHCRRAPAPWEQRRWGEAGTVAAALVGSRLRALQGGQRAAAAGGGR